MWRVSYYTKKQLSKVDAVVVGAGVVGLAVARALALSGAYMTVMESQGQIDTGISSRNIKVLLWGLYPPSGSM